jgi:hypothetical protein
LGKVHGFAFFRFLRSFRSISLGVG